MGQPLTVWTTAENQKRPYLSLSDATSTIVHFIKNKIYNQNTYNVLTENLTVNSIIKIISQTISQVDIQYVDSEIMNQLSYEVSNRKIKKLGIKFSGSINTDIKQTLDLLGGKKKFPERIVRENPKVYEN